MTKHLTPRELEVLKATALGRTTKELAADLKELAADLGLSPKTVEAHKWHSTKKLNVSGVRGITVYAIRNGIIGTGDAA